MSLADRLAAAREARIDDEGSAEDPSTKWRVEPEYLPAAHQVVHGEVIDSSTLPSQSEDTSGPSPEMPQVMPTPKESTTEEPSPESAQNSKDRLTKWHAFSQRSKEAVAGSISKAASTRAKGQDVKSWFKTRALEKSQMKAQRRYEKHARKAETSLFKGRREKFANLAKESKKTVEERTKTVNDYDAFTSSRGTMRELDTKKRETAVAQSREMLSAKSKIAFEKRNRRRERRALLWHEHGALADTPTVIARREALKNKPSMIEFRQAIFAGLLH